MSGALRFILVLVACLALLAWGSLALVAGTTRRWLERDLALRAELAVNGSRRALAGYWKSGEREALRELLADITHDERIMAAAACGADGGLVTSTSDYPAQLSCSSLAGQLRGAGAAGGEWRSVVALPEGNVHVSAFPLAGDEVPLGFVVLVHDLTFAERREETTRQFLLLAFVVLAASASIVTILAARFLWRGWSKELRKLIRGGGHRPEFRPILQDVRELVERMASDRELDGGGAWTPQRLKATLERHLHGERVLIVANREPYIHERAPGGATSVLHPASGLVTALEPVMRACSGVWIAHGSGSADREVTDRRDHIRVPPGEGSYLLRRVWLSEEEERGYYYGLSNEGLWPLCHIAHARPTFRLADWRQYQAVNARFADAVCQEVDSDDAIVLVQDYHFALAPRLIRERLPKATIIAFWHIPWPNPERFGICPWRDEILSGLLGSSIVGFHTQLHCNNFVDAVERFMEARVDRENTAVVHRGRSSLVRAYPISVDWPNRWAAEAPPAAECRASILAELGLPPDALLGVGVDRLDYTKGITERLLAVERLLERFPAFRRRFTFVQLAAPSRTAIEEYRSLDASVQRLAERINARFGSGGYRPIVLLRRHHEPPAVFKFYRAADLCYVSSLHDGMNLVAKEFVAAREDESGVLLLSRFTGAARELTEALMVNPYDLEEASSALATALAMPADQQRERMRAMRSYLAQFNVYRWAGRMLVDAARLRSRERLNDRLGESVLGVEGAA